MTSKWADSGNAEIDDSFKAERIESQSADGRTIVKVITEFRTEGDKKVKVVTRVRVTRKQVKLNKRVKERRSWPKFGASAGVAHGTLESGITAIAEEVFLEAASVVKTEEKTSGQTQMQVVCRKCGGEHWTRKCPMGDDVQLGALNAGGDKDDELGAMLANASAAAAAGGGDRKPGSYVPPHMRGAGGGGGERGGDRGDRDAEQKATLRVTNVSEDAQEADLHDLFRPFGPIARVSLPKDRQTGMPRGFAFVDFYNMADAQKAIDKKHGTGFQNLILSVEWAR